MAFANKGSMMDYITNMINHKSALREVRPMVDSNVPRSFAKRFPEVVGSDPVDTGMIGSNFRSRRVGTISQQWSVPKPRPPKARSRSYLSTFHEREHNRMLQKMKKSLKSMKPRIDTSVPETQRHLTRIEGNAFKGEQDVYHNHYRMLQKMGAAIENTHSVQQRRKNPFDTRVYPSMLLKTKPPSFDADVELRKFVDAYEELAMLEEMEKQEHADAIGQEIQPPTKEERIQQDVSTMKQKIACEDVSQSQTEETQIPRPQRAASTSGMPRRVQRRFPKNALEARRIMTQLEARRSRTSGGQRTQIRGPGTRPFGSGEVVQVEQYVGQPGSPRVAQDDDIGLEARDRFKLEYAQALTMAGSMDRVHISRLRQRIMGRYQHQISSYDEMRAMTDEIEREVKMRMGYNDDSEADPKVGSPLLKPLSVKATPPKSDDKPSHSLTGPGYIPGSPSTPSKIGMKTSGIAKSSESPLSAAQPEKAKRIRKE